MDRPFPAYKGNEPYIFVCYAHEDKEVVYPEIKWLHDQNVDLWYDEGISAGKNWRAEIGLAVEGSSRVLIYISEMSLKSDHCNREINLALDEGKEIVPVYLKDINLTPDLKVGLGRIQALHRSTDERYQDHLLDALGLVGQGHVTTADKHRIPSETPTDSQASSQQPSVERIVFGEFELDVASGQLTGAKQDLRLSPRAVDVLVCLAAGRGRVVSKESLHETVWANRIVTDAQISKAINELRNAFGDQSDPRQYIETLPKRGYRLLCATEHAIGLATPAQPVRRSANNQDTQVGITRNEGSSSTYRPTHQPPTIRVPFPLEGWEDWKDINPVSSMAISADGSSVVFVARGSAGSTRLHLRRLDQLETIKLAGTEGGEQPFFSPDGCWVGYFSGRLMKRISSSGSGQAGTVATLKSWPNGASWGPDDQIYYAESYSGLKSVSVSGGNAEVITQLHASRTEASHRLPHVVSGYPVLLLSILVGGWGRHEIWAHDLVSGEPYMSG